MYEKKQLWIAGASGHGKVIAALAKELRRYEKIDFLDDALALLSSGCVCGDISYAIEHCRDAEAIVGIGNAEIRRKIQENYQRDGVELATLVHPFSWMAEDTEIGSGSVVMAGAVIQPGVRIGKGVIINTSSSVDHDCKIGDYCHIAVGSHLSGNVCIGSGTWIGAGATVSNNVSICENVMVGAGAVVVSDIAEPGTYVGVPVRRLI